MKSLATVTFSATRQVMRQSPQFTRAMGGIPPKFTSEMLKNAFEAKDASDTEKLTLPKSFPPNFAQMSTQDRNAMSQRGTSSDDEEVPVFVNPIPDPKPLLFGLKPGEAETLDLSPAMMRVVDVVNGSQAQLEQLKRRQVTEDFQRHKSDTGSPEVQVALMSSRIARLASHIKEHHHDHHSRRGLVGLVNSRRRIMKYLKRTDPESYARVLSRLNLRDGVADKK